MHDFMQSLQMRCPVAATSGLSTQITASAPSAQPPQVHTATRLALDGDELQVVELARRLEQYARLVSGLARRRLDRPGRVSKREVDVSRVRGFVTAPGAHVRGERKLAALPNER